MIPTREQAQALWDKYTLPEKKRIHSSLVCDVSLFIARELRIKNEELRIDMELLEVGALLHDLDKAVEKLPGEYHPVCAARVLQEEGYDEVAELIRFHSVNYIEDPATAPKTLEEKILFLADKMVKQEIITVDKRFALWLEEFDLPEEQKAMLRRVYPLVKKLESELFIPIGIDPASVVQYVQTQP
jgi:putative nucleotidyltransferase with HDIG domain